MEGLSRFRPSLRGCSMRPYADVPNQSGDMSRFLSTAIWKNEPPEAPTALNLPEDKENYD